MQTIIETANEKAIAKAASLLQAGELVAFPTETVYGLGGMATDDPAMAQIFSVKGRPGFNPLIVHVTDQVMASFYVELTPLAKKLAKAFWPGPLTLVVPRLKDSLFSLLVSAGLDTVAVRAPAHPVAQALLKKTGVGIAAPSANRSGRLSPTTAAHVKEELDGRIPFILDGGPCSLGLESTVVDCTGNTPALLRHGALTRESLEAVIGPMRAVPNNSKLRASPGMLASHYAPHLPLRLNAQDIQPGEALLAFGKALSQASAMENLSEKSDLTEAAANLFAALRRLDKPDYKAIAVMPIPEEGLGEAINDRLKRAANR